MFAGFGRYTEHAQRAILLAQEEARRLNYRYVGTEHLLLGLIREGTGVAAKALESLGVNLDRLRGEVEKVVGRGSGPVRSDISYTPRAKKVIMELAVEEAHHLGHNYVGSEHLLLALIREGEGVAARVLADFGVTRERVGALIQGALGQQPAAPRGEPSLRGELADVCQRLYERGLVTSVAGNVSAREGSRVYITPTGFALDAVTPEDVVVTDLEGRLQEGRHRPSSELPLHLAVYRADPDVRAVVHTHSPVATAFSVRGEGLAPVTTEAEMLLGEVPLVPYAPPGSHTLGEAVARLVPRCRAALLERHGVVAWGGGLREAFYRAELVEETARVHLLLRLLAAAPRPAGAAPGVER